MSRKHRYSKVDGDDIASDESEEEDADDVLDDGSDSGSSGACSPSLNHSIIPLLFL